MTVKLQDKNYCSTLILSSSDVGMNHGSSCYTASTRVMHFASSSGSTISRLAQVRKDTPSLIDVKGLGRPKELIHWTRGGFPTVVEEDGGILRWCDHGV